MTKCFQDEQEGAVFDPPPPDTPHPNEDVSGCSVDMGSCGSEVHLNGICL